MNNNLRAGATMVLAVSLLSLNDAIAKHVSESLSIPQILFYRGMFATALLVVAVKLAGHRLLNISVFNRWVRARGVFDVIGTLSFLTGLTLLPIAVATTLVFTSPIIVTLLAACVLRERVGWRRWSAVLVGFVGVSLVTGVGSQIWDPAFLLPLAAAVMVAGRDLVTRKVPHEIPSIYVALVTSAFVMAAGLLGMPVVSTPVDAGHLIWLAFAAILICGAYYGWIAAVRLGELSFVAPLVYASILVAMILGVVIWNDVVSARQLFGISLIVASGVFTFARERAAGRERARADAPAPDSSVEPLPPPAAEEQ